MRTHRWPHRIAEGRAARAAGRAPVLIAAAALTASLAVALSPGGRASAVGQAAREAAPPATAPGVDATATAADARGKLVLVVKDGKQWHHAYRVMLVAKVTTQPQMAFWLEDTEGNFVATIYVTHRAATDDWRPSLGEDRAGLRRPSALPVWRHEHMQAGIQPLATCSACHGKRRSEDKSTEGVPELDAITGATPVSGFTWEWSLPPGIRPGVYVVKAEVNQSRDFTDVYRANLPPSDPCWSGGKAGSGQPSLVLRAAIDIGAGPTSAALTPVGHGQPAGATGEIFPDLSTLTTALDILESVKVSYVPAR